MKTFLATILMVFVSSGLFAQEKKTGDTPKPSKEPIKIISTVIVKDSTLVQKDTKNVQPQQDNLIESILPYIDYRRGGITIPEFTDLIDVGHEIR